MISPKDDTTTRPITDRVKESLFNLLRAHIEDENIIDFFAGTGTIGLEALSRGAQQVMFVEQDRETLRRLEQNIEALGVASEAMVVAGDALGPICLTRAPESVHVATFDPPYALLQDADGMGRVIAQMERVAETILDEDGYLVLRTEWPFFDRAVPRSEKLDGPETHEYKTMALHLYQRKV